MTKPIQEILESYPESYASDNLRRNYKKYLSSEEGKKIAAELLHFLRPYIKNRDKLSDIEKAQLLYTTIIKSITYNKNENNNTYNDMRYSYVGCIAYKKAVCMGIAELYTLLGSALGLKIITVIGYGHSEAHAWNIVWLNNNGKLTPYHLDATWDLGKFGTRADKFDYFLKSDTYMRNHSHSWISERYRVCPSDRKTFPKIPHQIIDVTCIYFNQMQKKLKDIRFRKAG